MAQVTLKDVYDIVNAMDTKLDRRLADDEKRLGALENAQSRAIGILAVIMFILSSASGYIWDRILGKN